LSDPLTLIDATLLFSVQVLIAHHPELLLPPEVPVLRPPPGLRAARHILEMIRELHHALETYRAFLPEATPHAPSDAAALTADDDIPF
jgi:hypothetical protein